MKAKFNDGTTVNCTSPVEQKLYRSGASVGWMCSFRLTDTLTSNDIDTVLTEDNISKIIFVDDGGNELFEIEGYTKLSSVIIRYSESGAAVEIQLSKGV